MLDFLKLFEQELMTSDIADGNVSFSSAIEAFKRVMAMPDNPEMRRAKAQTKDAAYLAVIDSIEPNVTEIDAGAFYASAAISLKRIADLIEAHEKRVIDFYAAKDNVQF